jgi:hypothetical protein
MASSCSLRVCNWRRVWGWGLTNAGRTFLMIPLALFLEVSNRSDGSSERAALGTALSRSVVGSRVGLGIPRKGAFGRSVQMALSWGCRSRSSQQVMSRSTMQAWGCVVELPGPSNGGLGTTHPTGEWWQQSSTFET